MKATRSIFGQDIEQRCTGYTPFQKFLVWMGLMPDFETATRLDEVSSQMEARELEAARPPGAEKGGPINFCIIG